MNKNLFENTFIEKEIENLNEMSEDNIIYDEVITGPQEEPYPKEYILNIKKWKKYRNKIKK